MIDWLIIQLVKWKGGSELVILFMAQQIIKYPERYKFSDMPNSLKAQIAEVLIDSGAAHLIDEDEFKPQVEGAN